MGSQRKNRHFQLFLQAIIPCMAATTKAKSGPMIPSWNDEVAYALVFPMILPLLRNFKSPGRHSFGEKTYFCALLNDNRKDVFLRLAKRQSAENERTLAGH